MNRQRLVLVAAVVLVLLGLGLIALQTGAFKPKDGGAAGQVGGAFTLVNQDGAPVTEKALRGKWSAVFFGYTYCPDICPGTLQALIRANDELGTKARDFQIVFISVDPGRDKPAAIKQWLTANGAPASAMGLTGTDRQVADAARAYKAFYQKAGEGDAYLMDHTTAIYLMDPKGRFVRILPYKLPDEIARQTSDAMRGK